jgi:hypothetical protein
MATATQAIRDFASINGSMTITVDSSARVLKRHRPPLWLRSGQGGGFKAPHVTPRDLVNLALAVTTVAAPDHRGQPSPITTAVQRVTEYRNLAVRGTINITPERRGLAAQILFPGNGCDVFGGEGGLGGDLERLVDLLARDTHGSADPILSAAYLTVELILDLPFPRAVIRFRGFELDAQDGLTRGMIDRATWFEYFPPQGALDPVNSQCGSTLTTQWNMQLIRKLADLWRDTLSHQAEKSTGAEASAETKTAASLPGEAAGSPDQPNDEPNKMGSQQTHRNRGEGEPQSRAESRAGHSIFSRTRSDSNERQNSAAVAKP